MTELTDRLLPLPAENAAGRACALEQALRRSAACTRDRCVFWEEDGAVIRPGCALSRTPLDLGRAGVADLLLGLRRRIEPPRSTGDEREARRELRRVLAAAFDDDLD